MGLGQGEQGFFLQGTRFSKELPKPETHSVANLKGPSSKSKTVGWTLHLLLFSEMAKYILIYISLLFYLHFGTDEGEYICQRCTIFGLEKDEVQALIKLGFKMTDHNTEDEGYEVESSIFKVRIVYML